MNQSTDLKRQSEDFNRNMMNYAQRVFPDSIKALQYKYGSRNNYETMEQFSSTEGVTPREISMIEERDSFF